MGRFLRQEKKRLANYKVDSSYFTEPAKDDGTYRGKRRPFCLSDTTRSENLYFDIRNDVLIYFNKLGIKWHDGKEGNPSNHLCDSQVCCINFLYPFTNRPDALKELLLPLFPTIGRMLTVESEQYVSFEWIGQENYLGEKVQGRGKRTRGANFTSADAIVRFEHIDGRKQTILVEWKYTESYSRTSLAISRSGTDRTVIYKECYDWSDNPIEKSTVNYVDLFYEPFYQLMRQQLLAQAMERNNEMGADIVSVLHIAPAYNNDFKEVTSPNLASMGTSPTEIWQRVVNCKRFVCISTEQLFRQFPSYKYEGLENWWEYIVSRYNWIK